MTTYTTVLIKTQRANPQLHQSTPTNQVMVRCKSPQKVFPEMYHSLLSACYRIFERFVHCSSLLSCQYLELVKTLRTLTLLPLWLSEL